MAAILRFAILAILSSAALEAAGEEVLLVVNQNSSESREIAAYYRPRRAIPMKNVCSIRSTAEEEISWETYVEQIEQPITECLTKSGLVDKVLYMVTTLGVPLKVTGGGSGMASEHAAVDSELTVLYSKIKGIKIQRGGWYPNPFFMRRDEPFSHARFPIYLVTRLAAYDVNDVKAMVDRSLTARNRGKFVVDLNSPKDDAGNNWLRTAAILLPAGRVMIDETTRVLYGQREVIGYAAWGSNDDNRSRRLLGFEWLPGAIATEFVSTDARTFRRPPETWSPLGWNDAKHWFGGSSQGMSADYLHEGATGCSGHVYEPYLHLCPRPDYLLPAYYQGRNLAESYYLAIPGLSWQNVVLGDPLCSLGKP